MKSMSPTLILAAAIALICCSAQTPASDFTANGTCPYEDLGRWPQQIIGASAVDAHVELARGCELRQTSAAVSLSKVGAEVSLYRDIELDPDATLAVGADLLRTAGRGEVRVEVRNFDDQVLAWATPPDGPGGRALATSRVSSGRARAAVMCIADQGAALFCTMRNVVIEVRR